MTDYKSMLRELMDDAGLTYKEAMMDKWDHGAKQCENCREWTLDPCEMATSGGVNGEDSICEYCFENVQNELCDEVRRIVATEQ